MLRQGHVPTFEFIACAKWRFPLITYNRSAVNPLKYDPSGTASIRKAFAVELTKRFNALKRNVTKLLVDDDAFGLKPYPLLSFNAATLNVREYANMTDEAKLEAFRLWLITEIGDGILTVTSKETPNAWWYKYISDSYQRAYGRAYDQVRGNKKTTLATLAQEAQFKRYGQIGSVSDFYLGSKDEFLRSSFGGPVPIERVKFLASRTYTDLQGVTDAMSNQMTRVLVDGLIAGENPRVIARKMIDRVDKIGVNRAKAVSHNSVISANAEGLLDSLESLNMDTVGIALEWSTSHLGLTAKGNASPCFPAGTMIAVEHGHRSIESIKVGDYVKTRHGLRKVNAVSCRKYSGGMSLVSAGRHRVISTDEHPFWDVNSGWLMASDMHAGNILQSVLDEHVDVDSVTNFNLSDSANIPPYVLKVLGFPFVSGLVAMPVRSINFKGDSHVRNQKINGISSDFSLLNKCDTDGGQAFSDRLFKRRLGCGSAIARKGAKSFCGSRWDFSEFCSACITFLQNNWPAANLGTIPLVPVLVPANVERTIAPLAWNVSRPTFRHLASHCAKCVVMCDRLFDSKLLGTSGACLRDSSKASGHVPAFAGAEFASLKNRASSPVAHLAALWAWNKFSCFRRFGVTSMRAKSTFTAFLDSHGIAEILNAAPFTSIFKSRTSRLFARFREAFVRAKSLPRVILHMLSSSLKRLSAFRARECKWHDVSPVTKYVVSESIMSSIPIQVYNIEVDEHHEYYANGLLVHNCDICRPMEGTVFSIKEARGLIPHHSYCRCSWLSVRSDSDAIRDGQVRSKSGIEKAIRQSIKAELPKRTKRTIAEQRERSSWAGATAKISKKRPKGLY